MDKDENEREYQRGGCGGFAKGNVSELIKDIEEQDPIDVGAAGLASCTTPSHACILICCRTMDDTYASWRMQASCGPIEEPGGVLLRTHHVRYVPAASCARYTHGHVRFDQNTDRPVRTRARGGTAL
jgi:hypothetical protein